MRLIIARHAKASPDSPDGTDFTRPLRPKGEQQAVYLGEWAAGCVPQVGRVISSRAVRADTTASVIASAIGITVEHDDALLVDEPVGPVVDRLAPWSEPIRDSGTALLVVGHNPQLERLVAILSGEGPAALPRGLRTGEAVVLEVDPLDPYGGIECDRIRMPSD